MTSSPPPPPARSLSQSGPSSLTSQSSMSSRNNPISLRIYKAIGTTFDDPGSREALEIVSSFYAHVPGKGKEKAVSPDSIANGQDVFGSVPEEADGGEEGEVVPRRRTLKGQSAAMARKHLKRDVERKLAEGSQRFLTAFGEVDKVRTRLPSISVGGATADCNLVEIERPP